jgi:beta-lactam-binding protein with PASTA domain
VIGKQASQAELEIKAKNLIPVRKVVESTGEADVVFDQSPDPGKEVKRGSEVVLFTRKPPTG